MCPYSMATDVEHHDARVTERLTIKANPWHPTLAVFEGTNLRGRQELACVKDGTALIINGRERTSVPKIDEALTVEVMTYHHEGQNDWVTLGDDPTPQPLALFKGWKVTVGPSVTQRTSSSTAGAKTTMRATARTTPAFAAR